MYEDKSAPGLKHESSHVSNVSHLLRKISNGKDIEVNFQLTNRVYTVETSKERTKI